MAKTNWMRVFLGGLLAGVVLNAFNFATLAVYFKKLFDPALAAINPDFQPTAGLIAFWIVFYLILGILAVWLYSAIRPRYGAGVKTALLSGIAFWILNGLLPDLGYGSMGILPLPAKLLAIDSLRYLVMLVAATLAGAWIYKEKQPQQGPTPGPSL
jgi:hypothetical protein